MFLSRLLNTSSEKKISLLLTIETTSITSKVGHLKIVWKTISIPESPIGLTFRNGVSLEYGLTLGNFQGSPDLVGHMATGRYTYRFNPRTSIFGEYTQLWRNFDNPGIDYAVYRPSVGIEHAFSPTLSARVQLGYYRADPKKVPR